MNLLTAWCGLPRQIKNRLLMALAALIALTTLALVTDRATWSKWIGPILFTGCAGTFRG